MNESTSAPKHLGLILDGNRRWAREHGLSIIEGHRAGYKNIEPILDAALARGVETVSLYVFSTENWNRAADEVGQLMQLFLWVFTHELAKLKKRGLRVRVIGSRERLSKSLVGAIAKVERETANGTAGTLLFCLNYGGQQEVVDAVQQLIASDTGVTVESINQQLRSSDVIPVDLIIRTSGEQRLSNFLLWSSAYSELMFTDTKWPDFTAAELNNLFDQYANRNRRFGK